MYLCFSVGGYDMVGGRGEELSVWTVTVAGRVMVRQGVTVTAPEGTGWIHIPTPTGREVSQLSVAASGHLSNIFTANQYKNNKKLSANIPEYYELILAHSPC